MKIKVVEKHPLSLRWNHWLNFPLLTAMVVSGLAIYWANSAYVLPDTWIEKFGLGQQLALGMGWHFAIAVLFTINGVCYSIFLIRTGHYRYLLPDQDSIREAFQVFLHDLGFRKYELPLQRKYNAAQRLSYSAVFLLGLGAVATGFAIYKPVQLDWLLALLGGYKAARLEHFIIMLLFIGFFLVHLFQVARAGWNNFSAMITGREVQIERVGAKK